ncbi:LytR/AlgR family response regulator transcription factor [Alteromonas lipolytica]|uniref:LytR/AlgR family response regulator transcription factor n=1 Tax=Alteromonas lipolytica TaxID=1856405 RepID=UPI0015868772|nr:LytTR family DNA-binding domain-containing protein [Alteromonas lipolytica]GGF55632.1 DNA-binding response regulator [Alteromonas lipolytica]
MNILIVEDEYLVSQRLSRLICRVSENNHWECNIRQAYSLAEAKRCLSNNPVDALFLDLNLQNDDGFKLLENQPSTLKCIVVSALSERAIEAFDYDVIDFVAKPFVEERIQKAMKKLRESFSLSSCDFLTVDVRGEKQKIPIDEICYIKASGHYSELYCLNDKTYLSEIGLNALSEALGNSILRVHKSYSVPFKQVCKLISQEGSKYLLQLKCDTTIPVSRGKAGLIRDLLKSL